MTPSTTYAPKRTFVVQQVGSNVLVRGNLPLTPDGSFAYDKLNKTLKKAIGGDFDLLNNTIIDVSLIDNQGELPELTAEFTAFGVAGSIPTVWPPVAHGVNIFTQYGSTVEGHPGKLIWMPIQGCVDTNNCSAIEPTLYNFGGIVDQLNTLVNTGTNTVIYYHCMNGHDRAGSLTACYMMKHMGRTRDQAMNDAPPEGALAMSHDWKETYKPLIEWYAGTIGK
jgi:hypothetical protein